MSVEQLEHTRLIEHLDACRCGISGKSLRIHVPVGQSRLKPPVLGEFHAYPELFYQIAGRSVFSFPKESYTLHEGDMLLIPPLVSHIEAVDRSCAESHRNMVIYAAKDLFSVHFAADGGEVKPAMTYIERPPCARAGVVAAYLADAAAARERHAESFAASPNRQMDSDADARQPPADARAVHDALLRSLLGAALCELLLALADERGEAREPGGGKEDAVLPYLVEKSRAMVLAALSDMDLSVGLLAEWLHCSPDYLSHLYKSATGESLSTFITRKRLERADDLLKTTTLSVKEISWACGFSYESYFTRKFKERFGVTPLAHRHM